MQNMEQRAGNTEQQDRRCAGDQGFMLLGLIVAIALILLALSVAATQVAFSLHREREVESARRADQYVRAIRRFYLKNQHYPGSIEQLVKTNNVRYLRQQYVDPLTGKADYRLIPVGQNKTTVKGFFGEPLTGLAANGLGSAAGTSSTAIGGAAGSTGAGAASGFSSGAAGGMGTGATGAGATGPGATGAGATGAAGAIGAPGTPVTAGAPGATGATSPGGSTSSFGSSTGFGSPAGTGLSGATGPIMGVGSSATGNSIIEPNEQTTYQTWEFLYDPRIELLKAAAAVNAGIGSTGAGSQGMTPTSSGFGSPAGTNPPASGTTGGAQTPKP
jgi:type II secretory pathway pseudopilin PulG